MASWLYRGLRLLLRAAVELYFVDIETTGRSRVPKRGPLILAANHPNSTMDPVVLGTQVPRELSFLARSGLFKNPVLAAVLSRAGVIPVYRRMDGAAESGGNEDAFRRAYEVLEEGGAIGIFPEGQNAPERHVREIRTGAARIALGAEAKNGFGLGLKLVPVGLNYEDRDAFLTNVLVRFGEPIEVARYRDAWAEDERATVRALTDRLQEAIREQGVHIHDLRHEQLVRDVDAIYGGRIVDRLLLDRVDVRSPVTRLLDGLRATADERAESLDDAFTVRQRIADAVAWYQAERPEALESIRRSIRRYKEHVEQARLKLDFADRPPKTLSRRREAVKMTLLAVLLAPIAAWGFVHNVVPYLATRMVARRAPDEAMRAIARLLGAAVLYPLVYAGWATAAWFLSGGRWWIVLLYLITLPLTGFWHLRYRRQLARSSDRILARTLFVTRRRAIRRLLLEREQLLMELDALRRDWLAATGGTGEGDQNATPSASRPAPVTRLNS